MTAEILNAKILVVDDQKTNVELLEQLLSDAGYTCVTSTTNPVEVCALHHENNYDLILLDLQMPGMDGFQVMEALQAQNPEGYIPVLVITAQPGHKMRALEVGAKDFISKPFELVEVKTRIRNMLEVRMLYKKLQHHNMRLEETVQERTSDLTSANMQLIQEVEERKKAEKSLHKSYAEIRQLKDRLKEENVYLRNEVDKKYNFGEIVGQSDALAVVYSQVQQVAPMNATVLLLGETGTGKGVVARAIHRSSTRKDHPIITVNCTTLPATLVESELFGREKGAFTGSDTRQIGRFELANGGTIFLDEIGEMPLELQSKLLRVIQDGEFERLGSPRTIKTDVRIIAATNRDLKEEIRTGKFRQDLYYRLNVFPITLPPLRERKEDIPLLVNHFVAIFNKKIGKKIETVSTNTLNHLHEYHWPGNVRELESIIERAVITSQGNSLQVLDRFEMIQAVADVGASEVENQEIKALADLEHDHICQVLQQTGWRIEGKSGAALLLGLNPSTLRARMRKMGIARQ
ncbi:sigma-54-dependent transcriptional regulator [Geopsychrobacter electrodiphilus]|uniref:sigma-54-dependent transcriptional regulator n=1 Tax=Geopsychrobacter electrodiphilus TaxID=225196 RepID=UPI000367FB1D|nr:sigma-54 dependent transcriptional regulator [Geopsychrobacter electrodiphilus]